MLDGRPLRPGDPQRVGPYTLTARLGAGGQGVVYSGTAPDGNRVAVKVIREEIAADATVRARFAREVAAAERVASFCIAQVLDADLDGTPSYIVSEYIDGPSLHQAVTDGGPRSGATLERLAVATATALVAIHTAGVVHRDFKPGNVMLGPDGPRVIDFGIARALEGTSTLTRGALGTPAYMAPEQVRGERVGPAADVFAWGCVIAYAATGDPPFGADTMHAVVHRILTAPPNLDGLEPPLRDLVASCLAKSPGDRPTALDLLQRLLGRAEGQADRILTVGQQAAAAPPPAEPPPTEPPPTASLSTEPLSTEPLSTEPIAPPAIEPQAWRPAPARAGRRRRGLLTGAAAVLGVAALAAAALAVPRLIPDDKGAPPGSSTSADPQLAGAQPLASSPGPYVGAWFGVGYQDNTDSRWPVRMVVRADGRGTIDYPGMRCSGDIRRLEKNANGWLMRYDIHSDPARRCLGKAEFTLRQPAADELIYVLYQWRTRDAIATVRLSREQPSGPVRVPAAFGGTWTGRNTENENLTVRLTGGGAGAAGRIEFGTGCGGVLTPTAANDTRLTLALVADKGETCHGKEDVRLDRTAPDAATLTHLDRFGRTIGQARLRKS